MATAAEIALLRRLLGEHSNDFTTADLTEALDTAPACPLPRDEYGFPVQGVTAERDTYGVAASLWEDIALEHETQGTAVPEPVVVTSERNGDVARTYGGGGKQVGAQGVTTAYMRSLAARLRKRSCNYTGGARTILVESSSGHLEAPVRGNLYPSQLVN